MYISYIAKSGDMYGGVLCEQQEGICQALNPFHLVMSVRPLWSICLYFTIPGNSTSYTRKENVRHLAFLFSCFSQNKCNVSLRNIEMSVVE